MYGQGLSTLQQIPDHPPRKVVLVPENRALQLHSKPAPDRHTYSIVVGPSLFEDVAYRQPTALPGVQLPSGWTPFPNVAADASLKRATWQLRDLAPELRGHYQCRVEEVVLSLTVQTRATYAPDPSKIVVAPLVYSTSYTGTENALTYNVTELQHTLPCDEAIFTHTAPGRLPGYTQTQTAAAFVAANTYNLSLSKFQPTSCFLDWDPSKPTPLAVLVLDNVAGIILKTIAIDAALGGRGVLLTDVQYPFRVRLQATPTAFSETIRAIQNGDVQGDAVRISAWFRQAQPFDPVYPMNSDRMWSNKLSHDISLTLPSNVLSYRDMFVNESVLQIERVKFALYPVGGKYDEADSR
jgi:hypothetical protein